MLNSGNKTYDKNILQIMPYRFSNDLFALKKCRILHIENLISNGIFSGIKLSMSIVLTSQIVPAFLKYEIIIWGQSCKIRVIC